ncbi:hypothetical protein [Corallococcus sp. AS-1-12]|uniref:hypothetical protein n=1 Tax=Corallococcus sp. AS-1-12 TaxID=2874598 RepID=UPI001CC1B62D|nr:hypothetical protein [Corallococcus sp. AS-1-12]MBZ4330766.1 hypothetical protein [Corallococcus sp. AS-1-12]
MSFDNAPPRPGRLTTDKRWAWHCMLMWSGAWFWMSSASPAAPDASLFARLRQGMTRAEAEALGQGATLGGYPAKVTYGFSSNEQIKSFGLSVFRREALCATAFKAVHDEVVSALGSPTSTAREVEGKQCENWTLSDSAIRICCRQASPVDGGTGWMLLTAIKSFSPHEKFDISNGIH